jgi:chemotaxis protein methyltransferase CheR
MSSLPQFDVSQDRQDAGLLAMAIVDTVREPVLVLDADLRIVIANRSFYVTFDTTPKVTEGRKVHDIDGGVWNIAGLRARLEKVAPDHAVMDAFEVERDFPRIGPRSMLLNARKLFYEGNAPTAILLGLEDVTDRRKTERALQKLLEQRETLLAEMSHRVANSLQIIASILLMKAQTVESPETRLHLDDARQRVLSVAAVQQLLQGSRSGESIEIDHYLTRLCETLAKSMVAEDRRISVHVTAADSHVSSHDAVSIGLIVTELVINAIKHAFPESKHAGDISVGYEIDGSNWKLSVADDGIGMPDVQPSTKRAGLGTTLMKALAQQLDAKVEIKSGSNGTLVSVTHTTFSRASASA